MSGLLVNPWLFDVLTLSVCLYFMFACTLCLGLRTLSVLVMFLRLYDKSNVERGH